MLPFCFFSFFFLGIKTLTRSPHSILYQNPEGGGTLRVMDEKTHTQSYRNRTNFPLLVFLVLSLELNYMIFFVCIVIRELPCGEYCRAKMQDSPFSKKFQNIFLFFQIKKKSEICHPNPRPATLRSYLTYHVQCT